MIKTLIYTTTVAIVILISSPMTLAQSSIENALDPIESELQGEGIDVIDFSTNQGQWGSLPRDIVDLLILEDYKSISDLASDQEGFFEGGTGLNAMRYQLGLLEAQKTQATSQAEEDEIQNQIDLQINRIDTRESIIRSGLTAKLAKYAADSDELTLETLQNLLFSEVDTYFGQTKWGNLSYPISEALKSENNLWENDDEQDIATLARIHSDINDLRALLANVEVETPEGQEVLLSQNQIDQVIAEVQASQFEGEQQINQIVLSVVRFIRNLIGSIAILWIIVSGVRMVTSVDESVITEQKRGILYAVVGLVVILLIERIVSLLYGTTGALRETLAPSEGFDAEIYGVVNFIRSVVGAIAVLYIVRAGFLSIIAQGEEEKISQNRKAIVYIAIGLIIVAINRVIIENIFIQPIDQDGAISTSNVQRIIDTFGLVLQFVLGFVGVVALGAFVYGAALLIMNYGGNDETITKAKTIMRNAIIGIIVIIAAFTVVSTLVTFR